MENKATKLDDVKQLLWHYNNLYCDTNLLVKACVQQGVTLRDGFSSVVDAILQLEDQKKELEMKAAADQP